MKKFVVIIMSVICILTMSVSVFAASGINAEEQKILDALQKGVVVDGKTITLSSDQLNQATTFLKGDDVNLTADKANEIIDQINDAAAIIKESGVTSIADLPAAARTAVLECARNAADVVGLTISVDASTNNITIKDANGNVVAESKAVIKTTGTDMTVIYIAGAALIAVIAGCVVVSKKERLLAK